MVVWQWIRENWQFLVMAALLAELIRFAYSTHDGIKAITLLLLDVQKKLKDRTDKSG